MKRVFFMTIAFLFAASTALYAQTGFAGKRVTDPPPEGAGAVVAEEAVVAAGALLP